MSIQWKRGTTSQNDNHTGNEASLTYDTETGNLRVHDGTTKGGKVVLNEGDVESSLKIAVIGDSLSAQNSLMNTSWPALFETILNSSGGFRVHVDNFSINGSTYYRALNNKTHNDKTQVEACIDSKPDFVIDALGINDAVNNVDSRTSSQIKSDASEFYSDLRNGLPDALLVSASVYSHDRKHGTVGSLKNKNVIPSMFNLKSSGILSGSYCEEVLDDSIGSSANSKYSNWNRLDSRSKSLADDSFIFDYWRVARLGCLSLDGLHPNNIGASLQVAYALNAFKRIVLQFSDQNYPIWGDTDTLFDAILSWNGSDYTTSYSSTAEHMARYFGGYLALNPDSWFLPTKAEFYIPIKTVQANAPFIWTAIGAAPSEEVEVSMDGGSFSNIGTKTNAKGFAQTVGISPVGAGTYTFRYKIRDEVFGPYSLTFREGPYSIDEGGTGATTAAGARDSLGISSGGGGGDLESPKTASLKNGWTTSNIYDRPKYYKDSNGIVYLQGAADGSNSSSNTLFTLPYGYKPSSMVGTITAADGSPAPLLINDSGDVQIHKKGVGFLDGFFFRV